MPDHTFAHHFTHSVRRTVEARVSAYLGRVWRIETVVDKIDESSHPAALLGDETATVFVKINQGPLAWDQLQKEVAGLRLLTDRAGLLTPVVIDTVQIGDDALVIMEGVTAIPRTTHDWRRYGRALAQLHTRKGSHFGLTTDGYWGSLYQDNRPLAEWPSFFRRRRLEPRLRAAAATGRLPAEVVTQIERISSQLITLCGPPVEPALLHGDAHQNNVINSTAGPVFIDPACYYGHPEMDLAFVDFFAPVPAALYEGYQAITPIAPGFAARKPLWLLPAWLAMVELDGAHHLDRLRGVISALSAPS